MGLLTLEHGKLAYRADFVVYAMAVPALAAFVLSGTSRLHWVGTASWVLAGLAGWTAVEYAIHRFVLHGLQPFRAWHEAHHDRPMALISSPTLFSAALILGLVFLPTWAMGDLQRACSVTLGLLAGYFAYAVTHHAAHHWRARGAWFVRRKRWHAVHHHDPGQCYGVTSSLWDHAFGTARPARASA